MPLPTLSKKLGMKAGMCIAIINPPEEYMKLLGKIPPWGKPASEHTGQYDFIHIFVHNHSDLGRFLHPAVNTLAEDGILWFSYPKKSGSIQTDMSRDSGWEPLTTTLGYRPVAAVSISDDWSALRFRPVSRLKKSVTESPWIDPVERKITLPPDFARLLKKNRKAFEKFNTFSFTHMKEYVLWITSAKKPGTRESRIQKAISDLSGKPGKA